ncbi:RNA-processing protein [Candidatus Bathyarchaeota archaeon A05DMB-2]|jgi:ribosomal RNA assembly protein|nr:RNA-processing protein [Candidatus Bathyarchaeota archaeon A05DMB-2]
MSKPSGFVRIPKERVGVLLGPDGKVKRQIEEKLMVELQVESESGGVTIVLSAKATDPSLLFKAKDVVTAIGRGFAPEHAFRLIRNEDNIFDIIDLRLIFGRSESDIKRVKGRIIGANGKTRKLIEELTEADVVVYGHTVGIIGTFEQVDTARNAVQMLINGSQHNTVYRYLQRKRSEFKKQKLQLWEKQEE